MLRSGGGAWAAGVRGFYSPLCPLPDLRFFFSTLFLFVLGVSAVFFTAETPRLRA
jgi:hypothetical protein